MRLVSDAKLVVDMARKRNLCAKALVISLNLTALFTFTVALTTGGWITIQEPVQPFQSPFVYNEATENVPTLDLYEDEFPFEQMRCLAVSDAGLWSLCVRLVCTTKNVTMADDIAEVPPTCFTPDFFKQDWMQGNKESDTTNAIIRGTRKAALTLLLSYVLLIIAVINGIRGTLTRNKHAVIGAVFFVLSGLFLLTSILLYMLAVNDEVGHRPKPAPGDPGPQFSYTYNWSMWHAVSSYIFVNLSAVLIVYLSQRRMKEEDKDSDDDEFAMAAMKRLVQLVNITGRRPPAGTAGSRFEMVEVSPITVM